MRGYMWLYPGHDVKGSLASWLGVLAWRLGLGSWPGLLASWLGTLAWPCACCG